MSHPRTPAPSHPRTFDLAAYLARIAWSGALEPTLDTLSGLVRAHMRHVPFENLDVLLGRGVRVDLDSVFEKLVVARRGGYCFEHGTLFHAALAHIGFAVETHAARVLLDLPRAEAPRTHMFLTVRVDDDRVIVDPGFGGHAATVPVPVREGAVVGDGYYSHRMMRREDEWVLEARIGGVMTPLWTSTLEVQVPVDVVLANHWVCTYPLSPFVNLLRLRAVTDRGRTAVLNRDVSELRDGRTEKYQLTDRRALRALLARDFGFDLPEVEQMRVPAIPEWS